MASIRNTINRTFSDLTGNPLFARAVGAARPTPLWTRFPLRAGIHPNGKRVAVSEIDQARFIAELDERIGSVLSRHYGDGALPKHLITIGRRPLHIEIPNLLPPEPLFWERAIPTSLQQIQLGCSWSWNDQLPVYWNRAQPSNAHILVAGMTGSGKTKMLQAILLSLMAHIHPNELEMVGIDMKLSGLADLSASAHFRHPVASDHSAAISLLMAVVAEVDRRIQNRIRTPALALVIDEATDLLVGDRQAQEWFATIARRGRELGVFIIAGTQKPLISEMGQGNSQFGTICVGRMRTRKEAEVVAGVSVDPDRLRHPGIFYIIDGTGEPRLFQGLLISQNDIDRTIHRGNASPSVLDIDAGIETASGREAVQNLRRRTQAEEDAETLLDTFGDHLFEPKAVSQNQMIEALGIDAVGGGGNFYTGRKRVRAALEVLTTTTEKSD